VTTAATIYMSLLGPDGLARVARNSHDNTRKLRSNLGAIKGVEAVFDRPFFHETVIRLNRPVKGVLEALLRHDIIGGYDLSDDYPELGHALLICATETKNDDDIERYASALATLL
jgi:glycine dehydrogenase subunit 1